MSTCHAGLALAAVLLALPLAGCSGSPGTQPSTAPTPFAGGVQSSEIAPPVGPSGEAPGTAPAAASDPVSPESSGDAPTVRTTPTATSTAPTSPAPSTTVAPAAVTLGIAEPLRGAGFGTAQPGRIALGGDPMGELTGIRWTGWGGESAVGQGTGWYVPAGRPLAESVRAPVTVRAFGLTTCGGGHRYQHVEWWFPTKGQTAPESPEIGRIDLCAPVG